MILFALYNKTNTFISPLLSQCVFFTLRLLQNPFPPSVPIEGIIKKNSYEPRDYESVDEKSLF